MTDIQTIGQAALGVLSAADPAAKVAAALAAAADWRAGKLHMDEAPLPVPDRPARPARPELRDPGTVPKRSARGAAR